MASRGIKFIGATAAFFLRVIWRVVPTVSIILVLNFCLLKLAPGDAADVMAAQSGSATEETMIALRERLGLNVSGVEQFVSYLTNLATLDMGVSSRFSSPVFDLIVGRIPATLLLMVTALGFALIAGILLGAIMGGKPGSLVDRVMSVVVLAFYSMPPFWGALMLIVVFSVTLGWLPSAGYQTIGMEGSALSSALDIARHLALPALSLSLVFIAVFARLTRASILEVIRQDYVRTAVAKGLPRRVVMRRHVLRNALIPVTTVAGVNFGVLIGGAIVIESVFSWPGLGTLALQAVLARDYAVLLGILLMSSIMVIIANVVTDLIQGWLDPRVGKGF